MMTQEITTYSPNGFRAAMRDTVRELEEAGDLIRQSRMRDGNIKSESPKYTDYDEQLLELDLIKEILTFIAMRWDE